MTRYDVESINVGGVDGIAHVCMVDDAFVERASTSLISTPNPLEAFACGSASTTSTVFSSVASDAAKLMVVVVFPTPPFWLANAMIFPIFLVNFRQRYKNIVRKSLSLKVFSYFCTKKKDIFMENKKPLVLISNDDAIMPMESRPW